MPSPLFDTDTRRSAGRRSACTVTEPPWGVYRAAFEMRLPSTWASWSGLARAGQTVGDVHGQDEIGPFEGGLRELEGRADRRRQVDLLERRRPGAGIALGKGIERPRQPHEAFGLVPEGLVGRPVRDDDAVAQRFEIALQVRQRRPQFVGGVRDEVAPHRLLALEARSHLIEGVGERRDLLRSLARDPGGVVTVRDLPSGPADGLERPREHATEEDRQSDAGDECDADRGEDDRRDGLVVHRLGVIGRIARLHHQGAEDLPADDGDPDGQDRDPDRGREERRERDPQRDAVAHQAGAER